MAAKVYQGCLSLLRGLILAAFSFAAMAQADILDFEQLEGWSMGGQAQALAAFVITCDKLDTPEWRPICAVAQDVPKGDEASARAFFEMFFKPVVIGQPPALFTGYYEPELRGSLTRGGRFTVPLYRRPPDLRDGAVYHSRAAIEAGVLAGRGLELVWVDDPVEAFFLHIQGSGRVRLPDGSHVRLGYAGRNGHGYRSVGQELIRRGLMQPHEVSAQRIKAFVRANPALGQEILASNPSYIFFRKIGDLRADQGPIGAMGRPLTALSSVAVDPRHTQLGTPVWIDKEGANPLRRLMIAQDTGGAIKGAQRADIFFGFGDEAGLKAGVLRDGGRMVQLLPIDRAYALMASR